MTNLQGMTVVNVTKTAVWIRLPKELQRAIDLCNCPHCTAHPESKPHWDTLAVPLDKKLQTWAIHAPEYK